MISIKKGKKVLISIITVFVFIIICFLATKIIYDNSFSRYDCQITNNSNQLNDIIESRQEFSYKCKNNSLAGFLYQTSQNNNGSLIVLAPGFNACSDSYLWQIKELIDYGWSVFTFDTTGCCKSEGKSSVGFSQEIIDLKATLDFIEKNNRFNYKEIVLMGHSRGGYSVCCALSLDYDIAAVISISGINSAMEGVISSSSKYVGNLAYANYGFLYLYQSMLFGKEIVDLRADKILNTTDTPVLIIHGEDDKMVPIDKYSIISYKDKIKNNNVEYFVCSLPNNAGHTDLLFENDGSADNRVINKINDFLNTNIN